MIKRTFEVDPKTVEIKKLLGKDFLELSMRTVSSARPNRNGSCFTKEAQEKALESYNNKPILAYFENGDFVSHDGQWTRDPELGMDFWDTIGVKGERPIGVIREKDRKEVVFDESDGLYWTEITCALWTQYSYRQVKRLIEDAQKAAKEGRQAKSISVEVDILDYEDVDGVEVIKEYALTGVTILGSRRGQKVEPGIEGAGLSVLDVVSQELYEKQRNAIFRAYERLDSALPPKKEGNMPPIEPEKKEFAENATENEAKTATESAACPECGQTPCVCSHEENHEAEGQEPAQGKKPEQEELSDPNAQQIQTTDVIYDLSWLIESITRNLDSYNWTIEHYEKADDSVAGKSLIIAAVKRMKATRESELKELAAILAAVSAEGFSGDPEKEEFEAKLAEHCSIAGLYNEYLGLEKECNEAKEKCASLEKALEEGNKCLEEKDAECKLSKEQCEKAQKECDELKFSAFMDKASSAIEGAKDSIGEEVAKDLFERCEKKDIFSLEALNNEIALAIGKAALANPTAKAAYSAPISTFPTAIPDKKAEVKSKDAFVRMGYKRSSK